VQLKSIHNGGVLVGEKVINGGFVWFLMVANRFQESKTNVILGCYNGISST
jgi:hypothetical protein